jgi:hypothetical protein
MHMHVRAIFLIFEFILFSLQVYTAVEDFSSAMTKLRELGFAVNGEASELVYRPGAEVEVDDEAFAKCAALPRMICLICDDLPDLGSSDRSGTRGTMRGKRCHSATAACHCVCHQLDLQAKPLAFCHGPYPASRPVLRA